MRVKDIVWTAEGMDVYIRSSKTIQFRERTIVVPVLVSPNSLLCPCRFLHSYMAWAMLKPEDLLFPYTYNMFASRLQRLCKQAGLVGVYSTHSLRRGAATFLSKFLPLHDVKAYGDWKSWAVLLYISDNYANRRLKDKVVARELSAYM